MNEAIRKIFIILLLISITLSQSGCSLVAPHRQRLSVAISERDAEIYINGEYAGNGNVQIRVPRNKNVSIMAKKEGYYTATRSIDPTYSSVGILDMIGGWCFLLPFLGLLAPGSKELEESNITIVLQKEKA